MLGSSASIRAARGSPTDWRQAIPGDHPVGYIDVSYYRDDFNRTGLKPAVQDERDSVRSRGRDDRARRRRSLHGPQRARGDQRALRLRASGGDRARRADRPGRPRAADRGDVGRRAPRGRARRVDRAVARRRRSPRAVHRAQRRRRAVRNPQLARTARSRISSRWRGCPRRSSSASSTPPCRSRRSPSAT